MNRADGAECQPTREPHAERLEALRDALSRPSWLEIATRKGLTQEVAEAGFVDLEVEVADAVLTAPTSRAMWRSMQENPISSALLAKLSPAELAHVERSVLTTFEMRAGGADRPLRFEGSCHWMTRSTATSAAWGERVARRRA